MKPNDSMKPDDSMGTPDEIIWRGNCPLVLQPLEAEVIGLQVLGMGVVYCPQRAVCIPVGGDDMLDEGPPFYIQLRRMAAFTPPHRGALEEFGAVRTEFAFN